MPQSLSAIYIHLVFSTKLRRPFLRARALRDQLAAQLGGITKTLECPPLLIGGVEDHVHLLCRLGRTITQAEWVKELKRVPNRRLTEQGMADRLPIPAGTALGVFAIIVLFEDSVRELYSRSEA